MNNKFLNFLGLCKKAGKLTLGTDTTIDSIKKNKSIIIFVTKDFSTTSLKKVENVNLKNKVEVLKLNCSMTDIQFALGKKCGVISINDSSFANKLKKLLTFKEDF